MTRDSGSRAERQDREEVPIAGYEGLYAVSRDGTVRSVRNGRNIVPVLDGHGYRTVRLYKAGVDTRFFIHRLVAAAFHGAPATPKDHAAHLDGNKLNNSAENIRWVSPSENAHHKRLHGTHQAGELHPRSRLTLEQVLDIRRQAEGGTRVSEIAKAFCITWTHAKRIVVGKRWKNEDGRTAPEEGHRPTSVANLTPSGVERIRAEAFEEAAKVADRCSREYGVVFCDNPAAAVRDEIRALALPSEPPSQDRQCKIPPAGWWCSREAGHEGPCAARPNQDDYRGWTIRYDPPPIPGHEFDWQATGPNYDASYEGPEDGWVDNGEKANAATREELLAEIDVWIEAHEDDKSCHPSKEDGRS